MGNKIQWGDSGSSVIFGLDSNGRPDINSPTNIANTTLMAGEDQSNDLVKVEQRFQATNIILAAPTTTIIKSTPGFLHSITINTPVASSVITLYDNNAASGTIIGKITIPAVLLAQGPYTAIYDVVCNIGLTVLTATGASDITVAWR